jgi:predicted transcriptional regulator
MATETSKTESATAAPDLNKLAAALSHPIRWRILKQMANGQQQMVMEIAEAVGCSADMASKHLAKLRSAGLVVQGHAHLYQIPKALLPTPGTAVVECSLCTLRLDTV